MRVLRGRLEGQRRKVENGGWGESENKVSEIRGGLEEGSKRIQRVLTG